MKQNKLSGLFSNKYVNYNLMLIFGVFIGWLLAQPAQKSKDKNDLSIDIAVSKSASFGVSGNCEMCKDRIEKAALSVRGVKSASWDIALKKVHIEFNSFGADPNAIHDAIAKAGHDTELIKAADSVYSLLPECCLYRK
jgi:copper chaperone CopZ